MEFGNLNLLIYCIIPLLILILMIIGMQKRNRILSILKMKKYNFVQSLKIFLISCGALLVAISLLSPQKPVDSENVEVKGLNIYALIDTSRSMMAEDVYPNRLEGAKRTLEKLLHNLKGDRIGFIPYSDSAYIQMPLTDDYSIGSNYINALDSNLISGGGTELYQALELAEKSFNEIQSENKTIIILSDGGDFDKKSLDFVKKHKLNVYAIGIGTDEGSILPEYINGKKVGFIKDENGSPVVSKLNSDFMKKLAESSNGKYYEINNLKDNTIDFFKDTANLERKNQRNENMTVYKKYFQIPLGIGMIFILLGYLLRGGAKDEK